MHPLHRTRSTLLTLALTAGLAGVAACGGDSTGPGDGDGDGDGTGTLLTSGAPMTGRAGAEGSITIYRITVPTGATSLLVTTSGGSGDLDLYLRAGQEPTETAADCESAGGDNDESCSITNPAAGTWYIGLYGYEAYSGATLTATVTGGSGGDGGGGGGGTAVTWASVTMGSTHACGLSTAGKAYCWGSRVSGETGDGDPVEGSGIRYNNEVPYPVAGNHTFAHLSAGSSHTCGLTTAGALYCWGSNSSGQIGDGGPTGGSSGPHWRNTPVAIMPGTTFGSVSAGGGLTCAVDSGGTTWCWGYNDSQIASGGSFSAPSTIMTPADANIGVALSEVYTGGVRAACGRTSGGAVYCWGQDSFGILGDGQTTTPNGSGPRLVGGGPYETVSVGSTSVCAISADGGLWCWGQNNENQLGYAASGDYHNDFAGSPVRIMGDEAWVDVAVGGSFGCALTNAGAAHCWGLNASGQAGIGSYTPRNPLPTPVAGGHVFASLASNSDGSSMCGVTTAGKALCWGYNTSWQLGTTHTSISSPTPLEVDPAI